MNKKKTIVISFLLITIFLTSFNNIPFGNNHNKNIPNDDSSSTLNSDKMLENPINFENLKSADIAEEQLNHNFSFNTIIKESWNRTHAFRDIYSIKPNNSQTDWITLENTAGANLIFYFFMYDLLNLTSMTNPYPSNFTTMKLSYRNESLDREVLGIINDHDFGAGYGQFPQYIPSLKINETADAQLVVWNDWIEDTNISYNAYVFVIGNREYNLKTKFIPTEENTQSDFITWELKYEGHYNGITSNQFYDALLEIEELSNFTIKKALGYNGTYWKPLDYSRNETHIFINESYEEYKIELQTPNLVSIISYNDNLTYATGSNELQLYVKCGMAGKLDIRIGDIDGNIYNKTINVVKEETVFFNYIMEKNATGGIGSFNVTLTNNSLTIFGVRSREILFHKRAVLVGFSQDTTAFSDLFVLTGFVDIDLNEWYVENQPSLPPGEILNKSIIPNASITYEFDSYSGELGFGPLYIHDLGSYLPIYYTIIDLTEVLITPGRYNITFRAEKQGYTFSTNITQFNLFKRNVYFYPQITPADKVFTIEETFSITINFVVAISEPPYYELFLRHPVFINLRFTNLDTGIVEEDTTWPGPDGKPLPVVQSLTISGPMSNTTLPGNYNINLTIDSEYYNGSTSFDVIVKKKQLDLSLNYEDEVDEDENFDISWSLESGNFTGNRENMTLEIFLDGRLISTVNLTATNASSGVLTLKLDEGDYTVTYLLVSPFYEVERTIAIEAVGDEDEEEEPSWLEENWFLLLLLILAVIAMSIFGIYMTFSRRRVKAQRELDSELVALKMKLAATENNIALIQTQISQIAGIYWILVIHSEQGTTMVEITEFRFNEVLGEEFKVFVEEGMIRDSALIGGFLTAIRNFSRETSGTSLEYQPVFNSQTDYSTVVNDKEVHRRILEGTSYFMAFISSKGTMEISEVLSAVNSKFDEGYGEAAKEFVGRVSVFDPFKEEIVSYLHNEIRELQKNLEDEILLRQQFEQHLKEVQEKIGITKNK